MPAFHSSPLLLQFPLSLSLSFPGKGGSGSWLFPPLEEMGRVELILAAWLSAFPANPGVPSGGLLGGGGPCEGRQGRWCCRQIPVVR